MAFSVYVSTHAPISTHSSSVSSRVWQRGRGLGAGSNAVLPLAVVAHVRRVLLVDEEERRLVRSVLHVARVCVLARDVGDGDGRGAAVDEAAHVAAALWGLWRAVQPRRHQAVLVLGPSYLRGKWGREEQVGWETGSARSCRSLGERAKQGRPWQTAGR